VARRFHIGHDAAGERQLGNTRQSKRILSEPHARALDHPLRQKCELLVGKPPMDGCQHTS
jgi:hypothetical protein